MFEELTLAQKIGQLLVVGLLGTSPEDDAVQKMGVHVAAGRAGSLIHYGYNVENPQQFSTLTAHLSDQAQDGLPPLLQTADLEGGKVNRFPPSKGFADMAIPSAADVTTGTVDEALYLYTRLGQSLKGIGINLNLGPCVDVNPEDGRLCPVIGKLGRSYGTTPEAVIAYAGAMVEGLTQSGCGCALKHWLGHGSAKGDTHEGFQDVSSVWTERELEPFSVLGQKYPGALLMTAHVLNAQLDPENVITFSSKAVGDLRETNPDTVLITDDLMMGALRDVCGDDLSEIIIRAFDHDLFILSGNKAGYQNHGLMEGDLPVIFYDAIMRGVEEDRITEAQINERFQRVVGLKRRLITPDEDS
jgi:beta-N-acetylhexosaminidase